MPLGELPVVWSLPREDARAGWRALCWSVGPGSELAVLLVQERHLRRSPYVKGWVGWSVAAPCDGVLVVVSGGVEHRTPVTGIAPWTGHLALLPRSRFLLVSGRTRRGRDGAWERNAVVHSPDGSPVGHFCIGDDIDYVITDRDGGIWTAYGDEGIYGGHPESGAGLARWDSDGSPVWSPQGRLPVWPLGGSAGATEGAMAWLAWFSHKGAFVSRVDPATGDITSFPNPLRDTDGIAVRGTRMLLTHGFHNRPGVELSRAELVDGAWVITAQEKLRLPGPVVMHCAQGRDGVLWLRAGDTWVRIEV
ncbi:hypothetical protein L0F81_32825 [Streptomyces tricolor]|uniref:Uncharacterized protein n=1 Tax=Streptomyces tricolor TaxID=68277 RepID=A0ABS9JR51_9ACTN|nr:MULTISPECIES: hypothetical protein [Streptomyces]MCG0067996.1 hypothetical protein [Streptomyces tricolor]BCM64952.1 hypothetical protein EASAB2608_00286 [Streptomyces sp. EAS-AB2608]